MKEVACKTSEEQMVRGHISSWVSSCVVLMKNDHMKAVFMVT
jgi:hypothetical protein